MNRLVAESAIERTKRQADSLPRAEPDIDDNLLLDVLIAIKRKRADLQEKIRKEAEMVDKDIEYLEAKLAERHLSDSKRKHSSLAESDVEDESILDADRNFLGSDSPLRKMKRMSESRVPKMECEGIDDDLSLRHLDPDVSPVPTIATDIEKRDKLLNSFFSDIESLYFIENAEGPFYLDTDRQHQNLECFKRDISRSVKYRGLDEIATLQYTDSDQISSIVSAVDLDCDERLIATAGVAKKIKIFDFEQALSDSQALHTTIHYPVAEVTSENKISSLSWNPFFKSLLVSTDYEGLIHIWDIHANNLRRNELVTFNEHEKRIWSVDFSKCAAGYFITGSDDCKVKLWRINCSKSDLTIESRSNVCCVQFHPFDANLIAFGAADHSINMYDLRKPKYPLIYFSGHRKAVSYIRFLSEHEMVSASTDSTLRFWDFSPEMDRHVSTMNNDLMDSFKPTESLLYQNFYSPETTILTEKRKFTGHVNERNFVGLVALSPNAATSVGSSKARSHPWIACGSENNAIYIYDKFIETPILQCHFNSFRPDETRPPISAFPWSVGLNTARPSNLTRLPAMLLQSINMRIQTPPQHTSSLAQQRSQLRRIFYNDNPIIANPQYHSLAAINSMASTNPPTATQHFISALTYRQSSNHLLAANSQGLLKILGFKPFSANS